MNFEEKISITIGIDIADWGNNHDDAQKCAEHLHAWFDGLTPETQRSIYLEYRDYTSEAPAFTMLSSYPNLQRCENAAAAIRKKHAAWSIHQDGHNLSIFDVRAEIVNS